MLIVETEAVRAHASGMNILSSSVRKSELLSK